LDIKPDNSAQWSHASISPFYTIYMNLAGIKPLKIGFSEIEIAPQLGDLKEFKLTHHSIHGPIGLDFTSSGKIPVGENRYSSTYQVYIKMER